MLNYSLKNIIGITIIGICFYFIYSRISYFSNSNYIIDDFEFSFIIILKFAFVIVLMIINWTTEALKWKYTLSSIFKINTILAIKSVIAGLALAIITPNRIGEIGGRTIFLPKENRIVAIGVTTITSVSQLIATIIFASFSIPILFSISKFYFILGFAISGISICAYLNFPKTIKWIRKIKYFEKYTFKLENIKNISISVLINTLLISISRYGIFIIQYYVLLNIFEINISISDTILCVGATYGLSSIVPTIALAELGLRGTAAILCFGLFTTNITGIVFATFSLWIINIAFPSIIGSLLWIQGK
jgi:hypothetical protein